MPMADQSVVMKLHIIVRFSKSMKNKFLKINTLGIVSIFTILILPTFAHAASNFPQMMYGDTQAKVGTKVYHGGLGGTYAVYNPDRNSSYGFDKNKASACSLFSSSVISASCFVLGTGELGTGAAGSNRMMNSKTTVGGLVAYWMPVLYFGGININGDVSGNLGYLLKFWGQNLYKGTDTADGASWNLGNYAFNSDSQFIWNGEKFNQYKAKIATLAGSQTAVIDPALLTNASVFSLQNSNLIVDGSSEESLYPDGKIWVVNGDLTLTDDITFRGKGTIIVKGKLTVSSGFDAKVNDSYKSSRLGIIVLGNGGASGAGDCNFAGNNKVTAMMMCENSFNVNGNAEFTGSFVSHEFPSSIATHSVKFQYDAAFDDNQPPGFRDLKLSASQEVGNK